MSNKNLFKRIAETATLSSALLFGSAGAVDATDIICNKQVQICVPQVVTYDTVRQGTREVPVTCYKTETRCIEDEISVPTCDPCNPVEKRMAAREVQVQVPYISTQVVPFEVHEQKQGVQYHTEMRTVLTRVHIDDCATPNGCYSQPAPCQPACWPNPCDSPKSCNNWYPGKNVLNYAVRPVVGTTLDVAGKVTRGVGELLIGVGNHEQHRGDIMRERGFEGRNSHAYAPRSGFSNPSDCNCR